MNDSGARFDLIERVRQVQSPRPVMPKEKQRCLTDRQREILDQLGSVFDEGFNHLTMADLASRIGCSLRTLYGLAESRDELVLLVVDRNLWRVGRSAMAAIEPEATTIEAIRSYLKAANVAVANTTPDFAHDCAALGATREMNRAHANYLMEVTKVMLEIGVDRGEFCGMVDAAAVARIVAGVGAHFASPSSMPKIDTSPQEAADSLVDIILDGLPRPANTTKG